MKIAIDVSQAVYGTGVSVYTKNLVKALMKIVKDDELVLFAGALRKKKEILDLFPSAGVFPIPPVVADLVWNRLRIFPIEKLIGEIDVLHTSDWTEPPSGAFKVTTVHDLYPIKFPRMVHPRIREVHRRKIELVLKESQRIIVPSMSTKNDLLALGAKENLIRVIGEAPSLEKASDVQVDIVRRKYDINEDYAISIGVGELKNTKNIIKAFQLSRAGKDIKLVLVGRHKNIDIHTERNVRILGHVDEGDIAPLLTGSKALIYTSLYEGYGIPILDAFACGVPVVTSNISSMPEVAGDAAILVDPSSAGSIAEGIEKALRGPKGLIAKGSERVRPFSWARTAEETLRVYHEAV